MNLSETSLLRDKVMTKSGNSWTHCQISFQVLHKFRYSRVKLNLDKIKHDENNPTDMTVESLHNYR